MTLEIINIDDIKQQKLAILNKQELDEIDESFSLNSIRVLASRYLRKEETGNYIKNENGVLEKEYKVVESPKEMFERVAMLVTLGDLIYHEDIYDKNGKVENTSKFVLKNKDFIQLESKELHIGKYKLNRYHIESLYRAYKAEASKMILPFDKVVIGLIDGKFDLLEKNIEEYLEIMVTQKFMPNSPTLYNAGAPLQMCSACFTIGMKDDMRDIMKGASDTAMIFKAGGGVGINYSSLRSEGDIVSSTSSPASGPISFMKMINAVTEVVKQGGKRRGANMGILNWSHPDIKKFISTKQTAGVLENFNISVGLDSDFWIDYETNKDKQDLLDSIAESAWKSAEPGLIYFDNANKYNILQKYMKKPMMVTNPCSEIIMYEYDSCTLGSINVSKILTTDKKFDQDEYSRVIKIATRFLDNIITMNKYPLPKIEKVTKSFRRIGLGVMGIGDLLYILGIPYNSKAGLGTMASICAKLTYESMFTSVFLAEIRGSFPLFEKSDYIHGKLPIETNEISKSLIAFIKRHGIRNSWTTTIAPTGSISMIADCSNANEPIFALAYEKKVTVGKFYYGNSIFESKLKELGLYSEELMRKIVENKGSIQNIHELPEDVRKVFVTAMDISPEDHVYAQAICQKWINNAISKTINLPERATVEDVKKVYILAHKLGCKGTTVYRDGSRETQVLSTPDKISHQEKNHVLQNQESSVQVKPEMVVTHNIDNKALCYKCSTPLVQSGRCYQCPNETCSFTPSCSSQ